MPFPIEPLKALNENVFGFPAQVNIWRFTTVIDDSGGRVRTWTVVDTTGGRIGGFSGSEGVIASQLQSVAQGKCTLPLGTVVHNQDRLEVDGEFFEVIAVLPGTIKASERVLVSRSSRPPEHVTEPA